MPIRVKLINRLIDILLNMSHVLLQCVFYTNCVTRYGDKTWPGTRIKRTQKNNYFISYGNDLFYSLIVIVPTSICIVKRPDLFHSNKTYSYINELRIIILLHESPRPTPAAQPAPPALQLCRIQNGRICYYSESHCVNVFRTWGRAREGRY